eukprot:scaffold55556_cov18-Prasinocladus_malaysianus.AAC.1
MHRPYFVPKRCWIGLRVRYIWHYLRSRDSPAGMQRTPGRLSDILLQQAALCADGRLRPHALPDQH